MKLEKTNFQRGSAVWCAVFIAAAGLLLHLGVHPAFAHTDAARSTVATASTPVTTTIAHVITAATLGGPSTTIPMTQSPGTPPPSDNCIITYHDPVAGQQVVAQVIFVPTGQVIAERTGTGPFVPADYAAKCNSGAIRRSAVPAQPIASNSDLTG